MDRNQEDRSSLASSPRYQVSECIMKRDVNRVEPLPPVLVAHTAVSGNFRSVTYSGEAICCREWPIAIDDEAAVALQQQRRVHFTRQGTSDRFGPDVPCDMLCQFILRQPEIRERDRNRLTSVFAAQQDLRCSVLVQNLNRRRIAGREELRRRKAFDHGSPRQVPSLMRCAIALCG